MEDKKFKVAVAQVSSVILNLEATIEKLEKWTKTAAENGANLILFPEAFISCYPRGTNFGAIVGSRSKEGREKFKKYWDSSIDVPGPIVAQIGLIARKYNVHLVTGVIERENGTLYCSVLFYDNYGTYLGKHRKLVPTASERLVWGRGDASTLPVFQTEVGKIGAVICWENYMPLLRTALYSKGIQIYCAPTADAREEWTSTMRHIALEGRCFVLGCNQYNKRSDYPPDFIEKSYDEINAHLQDKDGDYVMSRGGSVIIGPLGQILAGPVFDEEAILYADVDLGDITRAKFDFDPVGHYARPDIFTLLVNEREHSGTIFTGNEIPKTEIKKGEQLYTDNQIKSLLLGVAVGRLHKLHIEFLKNCRNLLRCASMDSHILADSTSIILLDIEGTTTSIDFVTKTLFPYARAKLENFLLNSPREEVFEIIDMLREQVEKDRSENIENVPQISDPKAEPFEIVVENVIENVTWQMDLDRKTKGLKFLQGKIWKKGYDENELHSHVFDDVFEAFSKWTSNNLKIYIYSSGSVLAQKLLFQYTTKGSLSKYISGYFDTGVGAKQEASSYTKIANEIGVPVHEITFFTDIEKEAEAAKSAGMNAILVVRPGNVGLSEKAKLNFKTCSNFNQIDTTHAN